MTPAQLHMLMDQHAALHRHAGKGDVQEDAGYDDALQLAQLRMG